MRPAGLQGGTAYAGHNGPGAWPWPCQSIYWLGDSGKHKLHYRLLAWPQISINMSLRGTYSIFLPAVLPAVLPACLPLIWPRTSRFELAPRARPFYNTATQILYLLALGTQENAVFLNV